MERKISNELLKWKNDLNRKPLILYGPRQVGKTYSTIKFGEDEYKTLVYINTKTNDEFKKLGNYFDFSNYHNFGSSSN